MTPPRISAVERALASVQTALWPESRAALRSPLAFDPPQPRAFARFGSDSWIVPPATVEGSQHIAVGDAVVLMEHSDLRARPAESTPVANPLITIGHGTKLARFVTLWATVGITLGESVLSSDYVALLDCWGPVSGSHDHIGPLEAAPIVIADGAYLGYRCIIGPGVTVGAGAYVGEGAVVFDDVPAHSVVYGNPAQVTRHWDTTSGWQGDMFARAT